MDSERIIEFHSVKEMIAYLDSCGDDTQVILTIEGLEGGDDNGDEKD